MEQFWQIFAKTGREQLWRKMTETRAEKIQARLDQMWEYISQAAALADYEAVIAAAREMFRDPSTSPAPFLHKVARETYPMVEQDSVRPEQMYGILGLIDNREKAHAVLMGMPDSAAPEIEKFLDFMLKELLPEQRRHAQRVVGALPYKRIGGPKTSTWPSVTICREICEGIDRLHVKEDVQKGDAQEQMALKYGLSTRMVQRIWKLRNKYLNTA